MKEEQQDDGNGVVGVEVEQWEESSFTLPPPRQLLDTLSKSAPRLRRTGNL